jgi:hypothetical protein
MKTTHTLLALALGLCLSGVAGAQTISYSPRTGDIWVDTELGYMNDYGRGNRDYVVDDMVGNFGAPRYLVNDLLTTRGWDPGDVYYACALAYQMRRPCGDVVRMHDENRGQGWGVIAKRMGIKPGSAEFHALKGHVGKSNGKFKAYRTSHPGGVVILDDGKNKGKGKSDAGHGDYGSDKAKGHGNDKAKGSDKGKGNDKAKGGKGNGNGKAN